MIDPDRHKPFVIPVFIPHAGCPHRCLFCDQTHTTSKQRVIPSDKEIVQTIDQFLGYRKQSDRWTEISFFGGNFLGLDSNQITHLLDLASAYVETGKVHGIRFSTRPDTINTKRLVLIKNYAVTTIEIGAQSMDVNVLATARRDHHPQDTVSAIELLKKRGYRTGLQIMVDLPGDTPQGTLASAQQIADLAPDFVRIYPCLVLRGSQLALWFANGHYTPMSLTESIALVKKIYRLFTQNQIRVIRMGLQPTTELKFGAGVVAGPFHPAYGELVYSALWMDAFRAHLVAQCLQSCDLTIEVHPKSISCVRGHNNANLDNLRKEFNLTCIDVQSSEHLSRDMTRLNGMPCPMIQES